MQLMVFQLSLFRIHPGTAVCLPGESAKTGNRLLADCQDNPQSRTSIEPIDERVPSL
jgi:hypothetical protein